MDVIVAKYAGFCPGVKRAWDLVEKTTKEKKGVCVLGELIHNRQALEKIAGWGVGTIKSVREMDKEGILIIRAHGEPPSTYRQIKKLGIKYEDATCLSVRRVQKLAEDLSKKDYLVVVCGEKDHPEAKATVGYAKKGLIIGSIGEARKLKKCRKIALLSQTTFSPDLFKKIAVILRKKCGDFLMVGTICDFTKMAQKEAKKLAKKVDLMIVIGGKQSSNTKRLTEVASGLNATYQVETAAEIKTGWLKGVKRVGILAGASTPEWVIDEVKEFLSFQVKVSI